MTRKGNPYGMTTPCPECPFRSDMPPYLRAARVREIEKSLERAEFPCHKTVSHDDGRAVSEEKHCAGALILMEKLGRSSQMMRISQRLGLYDPSKLDMDAPVWGSFRAMIAAQSDFDPDTEQGDPCHVANAGCEAPAGWMSGSGVVDGDDFAAHECASCHEPVCGACSRIVRRRRLCDHCIEDADAASPPA